MLIPATLNVTDEQARKLAEQFIQWRKDHGNTPNTPEEFSKFATQACLEYWEMQTLASKIERSTL